jgi:hypothetical protein
MIVTNLLLYYTLTLSQLVASVFTRVTTADTKISGHIKNFNSVLFDCGLHSWLFSQISIYFPHDKNDYIKQLHPDE